MASRRLCTLVLLLALAQASAYVIEETSTQEDMEAAMIDDIEKAEIENLADKMYKLEEKRAKNLNEGQEVAEDVPKDAGPKIEAEAKKHLNECNKYVPPRYQKKEELGALRKHYQAIQHGKNFVDDKKWQAAKKSENCSGCVLKKLCAPGRADIYSILKIPSKLSAEEKERECKLRIVRLALDVEPKHVRQIKPPCNNNERFRRIDGSCNNVHKQLFGATETPFLRITGGADYGDGISTLRRAASGHELPNARNVSRVVHGSNADRTNPDSKILTHLTMNFGQFMDHDITLAEAQGLNCEPHEYYVNPECINIEVPADDDTFRDRGVDFFEVERDAPHKPASECKLIQREHDNTITAYIDASNVYGSTKELADSLRGPDGTMLDMKHPYGCPLKNLLPPQSPDEFCVSKDPNRPCFVSGDIRNNENPGLNSVHTIFVRHHNRIAEFFGQMTQWSGDRIYDETRKIIGAQLQVITYNEFLPLLLSQKNIRRFDLKLLKGTEYFKGYDKDKNAQMTAGFAVAAYRFGHSLVQEEFRRFSQNGFEHKCDKCDGNEKTEYMPIPVLDFGNPQYLYDKCNGGVDGIFRGLLKDAAAKPDGKFSSSVQENLFRGAGDLSDLVSINIQRGRERGIPGYTSYRNLKLCHLRKVNTFDDLVTVAGFSEEDKANLESQYESVHDIDLFTGGMIEPPDENGGLLGPTFQCILAEQFRRLKVGDRFWHENAPNSTLHTDKTAFTTCQLREIRKTTFAKIICDNGDYISAINRRVFEQSKIKVPCNKLPRVDLEPWRPNFKCNNNVVHDANDAEW